MKKLNKTLATIMLMTAMFVAGCGKDDGSNNNGGNDNGGGNNTINGHEYVDLGLPSGALWATCNVGAAVPEDYGDYFAWGEVATKDTYGWDSYKYCYNGDCYQLTKYCLHADQGYNGLVDN